MHQTKTTFTMNEHTNLKYRIIRYSGANPFNGMGFYFYLDRLYISKDLKDLQKGF